MPRGLRTGASAIWRSEFLFEEEFGAGGVGNGWGMPVVEEEI